jgi:hypothetical protein
MDIELDLHNKLRLMTPSQKEATAPDPLAAIAKLDIVRKCA